MFLALWALGFLTVVAYMLAAAVRQRLLFVQRLNERASARLIAEAGARQAIFQFLRNSPKDYSALKDKWSNEPSLFKDITLGEGKFTVWSEYFSLGGARKRLFGLVDEERKVNLNTASMVILERLFQAVLGCDDLKARELAASVVDWRDKDSQLSYPLSAEDSYYSFLKAPYRAKNSDFEVLEELLLVKGFDGVTFNKIRDYVTIYSNGKININTAPWPVLVAAGLSPDLATKLIQFRQGEDGEEATSDDRVITSLDALTNGLAAYFDLSNSEKQQLGLACAEIFTTNSDYFSIHSSASFRSRDDLAGVDCVVNRQGKVLSWREF